MQDNSDGSAIQAASSEGHQEIVKLLLDQGADINIQGRHYGNALQAVSRGGHQEIVKLLRARTRLFCIALQVALSG
ncbi:ankyrin [Penicillium waksmanii]|uniref:ankyrin n=1 Tax=Penicillium waksmanii TaxID=69791 RepID=UPI0025493A3C|nr:ankyrin [Penicillium waksmanii]KAJ5995718.1 ankyrin [Penicillium waksmanii]